MRLVLFAIFLAATLSGCSRSSYTGEVSETRQTRSGYVVDMDGAYPNQTMTVWIPKDDELSFGGSLPVEGETISVRGSASTYRGHPEIVVVSPNQIIR